MKILNDTTHCATWNELNLSWIEIQLISNANFKFKFKYIDPLNSNSIEKKCNAN
jgi:hypothetical protein